ncbi:MAG: class I SAM-dependent methyltransferase [Thermoleophilia bacterium]|nr:class I SAM-dependent methyltransferase [Thermoleophilia bacterium]
MSVAGRMPSQLEVDSWPGRERRSPDRSDRHYLTLKPLAEQLKSELERLLPGRGGLRVLDIGCGHKPYLPFVADRASSYFGVDAVEGPLVDAVGVAEELPCESASVDLILCTQVLEHVDDPARALAEIHRVLAPGGAVLLSTHGVYLYHPDPPDSDRDYWRWTHAGLVRVVEQAGAWERIGIQAQGNVVACLGYIVAQFVDELGQKLPGRLPGRMLLRMVNSVAEWLDARLPPNARIPAPGSLSSNYLVTAVKPEAGSG